MRASDRALEAVAAVASLPPGRERRALAAYARLESNWNPDDRHPDTQATGLYQVYPLTRGEQSPLLDYLRAHPDEQIADGDLYDVRTNMRVFRWYRNWLAARPYLRAWPDNEAAIALAYVWGPGRVKALTSAVPPRRGEGLREYLERAAAEGADVPPEGKRNYALRVYTVAHGPELPVVIDPARHSWLDARAILLRWRPSYQAGPRKEWEPRLSAQDEDALVELVARDVARRVHAARDLPALNRQLGWRPGETPVAYARRTLGNFDAGWSARVPTSAYYRQRVLHNVAEGAKEGADALADKLKPWGAGVGVLVLLALAVLAR